MYNLLVDSDALIKLSKIGMLAILTDNYPVLITTEIFEESVEEGRKRLYEDAEIIDRLIKSKKINLIERTYKKKKIEKNNFGKGEISLYSAYSQNSIIITDDLHFTTQLEKDAVMHLSSAHMVIALFQKKAIKKNEALEYLERLRQYIRKDLYESVKKDIK